MAPRTLTEKIWDAHVVHAAENEPDLLFIALHLLHEVTSPQAFDGLRMAGRRVHRPGLTIATGFSGHGFGIDPAAGRLAADIATGAHPIVDPTPFRFSRFSDGSKTVVDAGI